MENLSWLTSTLASDAANGIGVLPHWIKPLERGMRLVGWVSTATVSPDDNLSVREALAHGPSDGTVLIVGGGELAESAILGSLVAMALRARGFTGVVTDGLVRDVAELAQVGLPIWSRGSVPRAGRKNGPAIHGVSTVCGGISVTPGDFVVADDDGAVVWPRAEIEALLVRARARLERDEERAQRVRARGELD